MEDPGGIDGALKAKEARLRSRLSAYGRVLVCYSGGTDSTLLLHEAVSTLGREEVVAVTAVSEIYPSHERERAIAFCKKQGIHHELIPFSPLTDREFCRNDQERCYFCKRLLLVELLSLAASKKIQVVIEGAQADDEQDYRPGARAKRELKVISPLADAGLDKEEVRALSRFYGLPTADLPAMACLASRVPYGTAISKELMIRIEKGEQAIRKLGFTCFRLRHHHELARLEFAPGELDKAFGQRNRLVEEIEALGWAYVALDLKGYRQGSLNEVIDTERSPQ